MCVFFKAINLRSWSSLNVHTTIIFSWMCTCLVLCTHVTLHTGNVYTSYHLQYFYCVHMCVYVYVCVYLFECMCVCVSKSTYVHDYTVHTLHTYIHYRVENYRVCVCFFPFCLFLFFFFLFVFLRGRQGAVLIRRCLESTKTKHDCQGNYKTDPVLN